MDSNIVSWLSEMGIAPVHVMQILFSLMVSILFIQSGLDKVFNWKGEQSFYADHFKKTILKGTAPLLMPIITVFELAAGFLSAVGIMVFFINGKTDIALLGMLMATLSIIQLFFGQRIAKDYGGAASLVPYFFLTAVGLWFYLF